MKLISRLKHYLARWHRRLAHTDEADYLFVLAAFLFIVAALVLVWFGGQALLFRYFKSRGEVTLIDPQPAHQPTAEPCPYERRLDGVCVVSALGIDPPLVAVMIENSREAWPLSGLFPARVVYEAPVEGNVPRFMAIYLVEELVEKAGPVRSARPYYLDWASEYGKLMYMHVGGSDEALSNLKTGGWFDINEFYRGQYFWRDEARRRPHNAYTSSRRWQKAWADYGRYYKDEAYDGWLFADRLAVEDECGSNPGAGEERECVEELTVHFLSPTYDARWIFNSSTAQYERYQNRERQTDGEDLVVADTVIVQRVKVVTIDEVGRKRIDTIGEGEALVLYDGRLIRGQWEKASPQDRTQFYDAEGNLIPLKPGKIWIEVIGKSGVVEWK